MNRNLEYIIGKIQEYSKIPSLSYREEKFAEYLKADIPTEHYTLIPSTQGSLFYESKVPSNILITAHMDRIPVPQFKFEVFEDIHQIKGQLDNVISVAIARLLIEKHLPFNIMFTTVEEIMKAGPQIDKMNKQYGGKFDILDLDIDVAVNEGEVNGGCISLRDKDIGVNYYMPLVGKLRAVCTENQIGYITKDGHWLLAQVTSLLEEDENAHATYVGLPIAEYHSNHERISFGCINNAVALFESLAKEK